ncbi:DUF922 domain-containing protein [Seonamhaeicola maritimus]|uniref:DUF922 domain-containing protein n=1 Tax=Seonamhaeicola maritimus TaxID=2591822 RepID=A0A5C7GF77_9FLAO|nr:DUF922 domain-containing protein [Seonamhaeicola maritimus]TXG35634.1 DUF922 domain-containing protein [Seonamhaeicola maritimus]
MIRLVFLLCCFLCVKNDEPVIAWNDTYKLTWSDFKGEPDIYSSAVATTASGITFGFSIKQTNGRAVSFKTNVNAHFYPKKSWYKPDRANIHVLNHEQLHFNITELFARKFRYRISKIVISKSLKEELQNLHKTINKELAMMQDKYDDETNHSRSIEFQSKWEGYIKLELKKYSKYKSN